MLASACKALSGQLVGICLCVYWCNMIGGGDMYHFVLMGIGCKVGRCLV